MQLRGTVFSRLSKPVAHGGIGLRVEVNFQHGTEPAPFMSPEDQAYAAATAREVLRIAPLQAPLAWASRGRDLRHF